MLDHKATFLSAQSAHQVITRLTSGKKQPISYKRLASSLHGLSVRGAQFSKWMMMITIYEQKRPPRLPILSQVHPIHALLVYCFNTLNAELNPICCLLALLAAHHFLHVSRIRVKSLTIRLLMSCIYGASILDVSRSHTTTNHSR